MKIAHKGLVLITVTLGVELLFLAVLANLLMQADKAIKRESLSKQIIYTASNVARNAIECGTNAAIYKFSKVMTYRERTFKCIDQGFAESAALEELVKNDPAQVARMAQCKKVMVEARDRIKDFIQKTDESLDTISVPFTRKRDEKSIVEDITEGLSGVVEYERKSAKLFAERERSARQAVITTLVAGVVLNILLAVGIAVFFFHDIAKRINLVMDNTRRMAKGLSFNPPIGGRDEIAELDNAFHATATELQESEEMKRMLIGMVSHDLRSPLTSISAALELLDAGILGELTESAHDTVGKASYDVSRLLKLTDDLLDAEKLATGNIALRCKKFRVSDLIDDVMETMNTVAEQHGVSFETPSDYGFEIEADPDRLYQVLVNLVGNAIKYSPSGKPVRLDFALDNGDIEFRVTDQGPGIAKEYQEVIFEKFMQVERDDIHNDGKGLGLAICKSLVSLHGGSIGVESEVEKGSTFWVRIPSQSS